MDNTSTQHEINILRRRLAREKQAREAAESLLDDYAKKSFLANENLRKAVEKASAKQEEIEFFVKSAAELQKSQSSLALVESLLKLCVDFTDAAFGTCYFCQRGEIVSRGATYGDPTGFDVAETVAQCLPTSEEQILSSWCVQDVEITNTQENVWFLSSNFKYVDGTIGWLVFFIETPFIDEEKLYILDSHLAHLRTGLESMYDGPGDGNNAASNALEKELNQTKKQLAAADRMSSLGFLASGVAHEINNPLAFIASNNRYLQRTLMTLVSSLKDLLMSSSDSATIDALQQIDLPKLEQDVFEVLDDNMHGLNRLSGISDNLRTFIHTGDKGFVKLNLNRCVERAVKMASFSKKSQNLVTVNLLEGEPEVFGNEGEIEQVLLNIFINALQAIGDGGSVEVTLINDADTFSVKIRDDGPGISEANLEKIFSPFFTTKVVGEGTGLGLAISKNIIDAHNGALLVDSVVGVGTCFSIVLPKADDVKD
ncbi:sensor histidine kinase [Alteromonas sp. A079]|uniref:sensor histidine kinase n=1 Tax=Alteromonas sp. A079 TaxID=3410268 RepID=UPI003BA2E88E